MMEKVLRVAQLFDLYGDLLTERQQEFIRLYYEEDFSLGEIAITFKISRQAVHDTLRRAEALLEDWEEKLGFLRRNLSWSQDMNRVLKLLARLKERVGGDKESLALIEEMRELVNPFWDNWGKGGEKC
ncbi:MAG: YlxM family DNA-binding protein [bacterium]